MEHEAMHKKTLLAPALLGIRKALQTTLLLTKVIVPVTLILVILDRSGILARLAIWLAPLLRIFGLPGEAALPIFLGFFINIYAAMGAIAVMSLSAEQITVIAAMILTCHALLMETSVLKMSGVHPLLSVVTRVGAALLLGLALHGLYRLTGVFLS